ncbi:MAG: hypothetical protein A2091_09525 [Desulfuromonadales bacterium GWD2_61_12]|nr:MAG: hypothetical protein A2005_12815 [Desulfuromonadales bacterium GWC2_61_20]OGR33347.1 MAG: hypothetical protein A2091_09525 [Desulfuromonadales bacterium GWD2_61_12]HAD04190.1 hypothetical protein [Desulfuromonas sp.]HBT83433.1 hypothetical protein [Desulfuromonas sp.]
MTNLYECGRCGVVSEASNHLCQPLEVAGREGYCGILAPRDICDSMQESLTFECASCGRPAENKELLCDPHKIR